MPERGLELAGSPCRAMEVAPGRTCERVRDLRGSSLFLRDGVPWEGPQAGAGQGFLPLRGRLCHELTVTSIPCASGSEKGRNLGESKAQEADRGEGKVFLVGFVLLFILLL